VLVVLPVVVSASVSPVVLVSEGQRKEILPVARGDVELVPLDQIVGGLDVIVQSDPKGGAVTLRHQKHEVALYHKKSLASIDGDLRLLSAAVVFEDGRWLVPVDSLPRLLGPLLGRRAEWRAAARVLVIGNVGIPRIGVSTFVSGDVARVVLEASESVPFRVAQEEARVTIAVARDLVDADPAPQKLTGGIVESVQFVGGKDNLFVITLGKRFQQVRAFEQESPPRLVLEFQGPPQAVLRPSSPAPVPPPRAAPAEAVGARTIVIDPGHGGEEVGAQGPGGTLEKDVTLAIARKLRTQLTDLGLRVFLTRDKDEDIPLDERTAIANNFKADLFLSIHANASRSQGAFGSEVYFLSYQASDEESRRMAISEGASLAPSTPVPAGSDLALILWDMAQAEHLEESSALASRIQEELAVVTGSEGRGVKQAPFRVLVGAAMPAVLVEVAFISNPEEEKLLASEPWQGRVAGALTRGISRYEESRRASLGGFEPRVGQ
jgi:N-acetylmuramoyl-L-alanine amidase